MTDGEETASDFNPKTNVLSQTIAMNKRLRYFNPSGSDDSDVSDDDSDVSDDDSVVYKKCKRAPTL